MDRWMEDVRLFQMPGEQLVDVLKDALRFADKDKAWATTRCVNLTRLEGQEYAVATDRYQMLLRRLEGATIRTKDEKHPVRLVNIDRDEVKNVIARFKGFYGPVDVTTTHHDINGVQFSAVAFNDMVVPVVDNEYPDWMALIDALEEPACRLVFDPEELLAFCKQAAKTVVDPEQDAKKPDTVELMRLDAEEDATVLRYKTKSTEVEQELRSAVFFPGALERVAKAANPKLLMNAVVGFDNVEFQQSETKAWRFSGIDRQVLFMGIRQPQGTTFRPLGEAEGGEQAQQV